jgi:ElaB/YqjD/DUF883 family membrane-anchored ribosome-binding protein
MSTERTARAGTTDYAAAIDDITSRGAAAIRGAKTGVEDAVSEAADKGREALDSARDMRDSVANIVIDSIRTRPYTTLAIAGAIGFLYGAMRRR